MIIRLSSTNCVAILFYFTLFYLFIFFFHDAKVATLCSKSERFHESMAKWFHDSGSSMYIFLDDLPSQTAVCLNNGRR